MEVELILTMMLKMLASAMILGGTHQNISFTYDSVNRTLSAIAQAGGGGGGGTTYDLTGSNNTSNQALLNLVLQVEIQTQLNL